jgi:hypothetical protein
MDLAEFGRELLDSSQTGEFLQECYPIRVVLDLRRLKPVISES